MDKQTLLTYQNLILFSYLNGILEKVYNLVSNSSAKQVLTQNIPKKIVVN